MPPAPDPDMVGCWLNEDLGVAARGRRGRRKAWGKKGESYLLIRAVNIERPPPIRLKIRLLPRLCKWHGWVTYARIDENPVIRGHNLCFDKTCQ